MHMCQFLLFFCSNYLYFPQIVVVGGRILWSPIDEITSNRFVPGFDDMWLLTLIYLAGSVTQANSDQSVCLWWCCGVPVEFSTYYLIPESERRT